MSTKQSQSIRRTVEEGLKTDDFFAIGEKLAWLIHQRRES
jgi:hypothetical protein